MTIINHECYISLEVAKLLKEAGFDWECCYCYDAVTKDFLDDNEGKFNFNEGDDNDFYSAPTLDVVQRWLREIHHLHITIFSSSQESWMFRITKPHQKLEDGVYGEDFYTFEEAQEAGIKKALEIILEKGE